MVCVSDEGRRAGAKKDGGEGGEACIVVVV